MKLLMIVMLLAVLLACGAFFYYERIANPRVTRELMGDPAGERAGIVMLISLPSGRVLPVNYLREGDRVYAGADGRWWRELTGGEHAVSLWIRGEELTGRAHAVERDPDHTADVFARLRPNAIKGFGTLVEIRLDDSAPETDD